jgi:hypothetical protein
LVLEHLITLGEMGTKRLTSSYRQELVRELRHIG